MGLNRSIKSIPQRSLSNYHLRLKFFSYISNVTDETQQIIENNTAENNSSQSFINQDVNISNEENISTLIKEPYFYTQWYLEKNATFYEENFIEENASIHFGQSPNYTGKGVKIAIIDDGLDVTHPELNGSIVATYNITTHSSNVAHTSMSEHHGTAVTGIIAANDNGIGIK
ncbi:MAG TPA: hypothetical protein ENK82_06135, partial [Campylobacterales bacterium]|nr:hypothetical protein [Campylobacterales bacterium]